MLFLKHAAVIGRSPQRLRDAEFASGPGHLRGHATGGASGR